MLCTSCLTQLLAIRCYDRVGNDEVLQWTGLTSLTHLLSRRRISVFGHVARQTWLYSSTSTYRSTDLLTARGVAHLVVHGTSGSTSYETIPRVRQESSGGVLSTVDMVVQRRDGPRRLRDHDGAGGGGVMDDIVFAHCIQCGQQAGCSAANPLSHIC